MAWAGMEVRDPNGIVIFDTSIKVMKTLGSFNTSTVDGSMVLPIYEAGDFTYITQMIIVGPADPTIIWVMPLVTWDNHVVSWTFPRDTDWNNSTWQNIPLKIIYGVQ